MSADKATGAADYRNFLIHCLTSETHFAQETAFPEAFKPFLENRKWRRAPGPRSYWLFAISCWTYGLGPPISDPRFPIRRGTDSPWRTSDF
jgi:hypothetical protein